MMITIMAMTVTVARTLKRTRHIVLQNQCCHFVLIIHNSKPALLLSPLLAFHCLNVSIENDDDNNDSDSRKNIEENKSHFFFKINVFILSSSLATVSLLCFPLLSSSCFVSFSFVLSPSPLLFSSCFALCHGHLLSDVLL